MPRYFRTMFSALLLGIAICGCQFGATPGSVENGDTPAGQPSGMLTFAASKFSRSTYEPEVEAFNALQQGYSVQCVPLDDSVYLGPDAAALLASTADTSVILPGIGETDYASYFLDLQPLVDADPEFDTGGYLPGVLDACQSGGLILGLPLSVTPSLIYYNPNAFASANIAYPQPGWTWDDFRNAASLLAQAGGEGTYGFAPHGEPLNLLAPLVTASLDRNGGEVDSTDIAASVELSSQ